MNNPSASIKIVNKDFCNLFLSKYLNDEWGITAGFRTIPAHIAIMRKQVADWQLSNDCSNSLCTSSKTQSFTVISTGVIASAGTCVLNPPLSAYDSNWKYALPGNVNEIIIDTFTR
jgi:hypothetical protein